MGMAGLSQRDLVLSQRAEAQLEQQKRDEELAKRLQVQLELEENEDSRLAREAQDLEYAKMIHEKDKAKLKRAKERKKIKKQLQEQQQQNEVQNRTESRTSGGGHRWQRTLVAPCWATAAPSSGSRAARPSGTNYTGSYRRGGFSSLCRQANCAPGVSGFRAGIKQIAPRE